MSDKRSKSIHDLSNFSLRIELLLDKVKDQTGILDKKIEQEMSKSIEGFSNSWKEFLNSQENEE